MSTRVAFRWLLAREQLRPAIDMIEHLVKAEKWDDARDAIQKLARSVGVIMTLSSEVGVRIGGGFWSALDPADQTRFEAWIDLLVKVAEIVGPRVVHTPSPKPFEGMWLDRIFDRLRDDLPWLQDLMRDDSDVVKHGRFEIIPTKGVTDVTEAIATLDAAASAIQSKFPKVLYGKVYVRKDLRGNQAGSYTAATDTISLSMYVTANRNSVMTLIHEFGHRYWSRNTSGDQRDRFTTLSTIGDVKEAFFKLDERYRFADEWIARSRAFRDDVDNKLGPIELSDRAEQFFGAFQSDNGRAWFKSHISPLLRRFEDGDESVAPRLRDELARSQSGGNLRVILNERELKPLSASAYGATAVEENFAESFLAFCTGKALPGPLQAFMASL